MIISVELIANMRIVKLLAPSCRFQYSILFQINFYINFRLKKIKLKNKLETKYKFAISTSGIKEV